jgi:serine/threonine protein kinase
MRHTSPLRKQSSTLSEASAIRFFQGELPESLSKVKDKNLKEFIQCCIVQKAEDRPSASELQQHLFLVKKEEPKLSKLDYRKSLDQSSEHRASVRTPSLGERTQSAFFHSHEFLVRVVAHLFDLFWLDVVMILYGCPSDNKKRQERESEALMSFTPLVLSLMSE